MPRKAGQKAISDDVRHAATLDYLRGAHPEQVASEYEISGRRVFQLAQDARRDPEGAVEKARSELAFREEVREILTGIAEIRED